MKGISVIIRTLNEEHGLTTTLRSLDEALSGIPHEILVVDSGSKDKTVAIAESRGLSVIHIPQQIFSWGRSLNWGIKAAQYQFIFLISGHCYFDINQTNFEAALAEFESKNQLSAIYGRQVPIPNVDPFEDLELTAWYPPYPIVMKSENELNGVSNACCLFKKDIWTSYPFDESLLSNEDEEWCCRLVKSNKLFVIYSPIITIHHSHPMNISYKYRKWYLRGTAMNDISIYRIMAKTLFNILKSPISAVRLRTDTQLERYPLLILYDYIGYVVMMNVATLHGRFKCNEHTKIPLKKDASKIIMKFFPRLFNPTKLGLHQGWDSIFSSI